MKIVFVAMGCAISLAGIILFIQELGWKPAMALTLIIFGHNIQRVFL